MVVAGRLQAAVLIEEGRVAREPLPRAPVVRVTSGAEPRQDDVHLRWSRVAERRPIVAPLLRTQRRVHPGERRGRFCDVVHEHDEIEVVRIDALDGCASREPDVRGGDARANPPAVLVHHVGEGHACSSDCASARNSWGASASARIAASRPIAASASAARADIGSLDFGGGEPWWLQPGRRDRPWLVAERAGEAAFDAPEESISRALEFLADRRTDVPGGTFLFVLSDFLAGPATHSWIDALGLGWDVVPVVIQDPVWERSWPDVGGVAVPVAEPRGRRTALVRLSGREAESLRREHEERYAAILAELQSVGLRPVEIESAEPFAVDEAFLAWAEERRRGRWAR